MRNHLKVTKCRWYPFGGHEMTTMIVLFIVIYTITIIICWNFLISQVQGFTF